MKRARRSTPFLAFLLAACASNSGTERDGKALSVDAASPSLESPFPCVDPVPLGGGRYWCAAGFVHRPAPETCPGTGFCTSDADCGGERVCECGTHIAVSGCIRSDCTSDADCEGGLLCTSYVVKPHGGRPDPISNLGFACQKPADRCASDAHCAPGERCFTGQLPDAPPDDGGLRPAARHCVPWDGPVSEFPGPVAE